MSSRVVRALFIIPVLLVGGSVAVWVWRAFAPDPPPPAGPRVEVESAVVDGIPFEIEYLGGSDTFEAKWGRDSVNVHRGNDFLDYSDGVLVVNGSGFPSPNPGEVVRWKLAGPLSIGDKPQTPHALQPRPLAVPGVALRWQVRPGADSPRDTLNVDWAVAGRVLVSANGDGAARVWDADAHTIRHLLIPDAPKVGRGRWGLRAAISADGKTVATANVQADAVTLWDATTGVKLGTLTTPPGKVTALAFAGDGRLLEARDGTLYARDLSGDRAGVTPLGAVHAELNVPFAFHPPTGTLVRNDGREIVVSRPDVLRGANASAPAGGLPEVVVTKASEEGCVALSTDGRLLGAFDGISRLAVYDAATDKLRTRLRWRMPPDRQSEPPRITCMAFFRDGKTLAVGGPDSVRLYDLDSGRERGVLGSLSVRGLAVSPDGRTLAAALRYGEGVHLWETAELVAK